MPIQDFILIQKRTRRAMNKLARALINMQPFVNYSKVPNDRKSDILNGIADVEQKILTLRDWLMEQSS